MMAGEEKGGEKRRGERRRGEKRSGERRGQEERTRGEDRGLVEHDPLFFADLLSSLESHPSSFSLTIRQSEKRRGRRPCHHRPAFRRLDQPVTS